MNETVKKLDEAIELAEKAKRVFQDTIEESVVELCKEYNVDHICFETNSVLPTFTDDAEENVFQVASVRVDPETDWLQVTPFFEEDWDSALKEEGYLWVDALDANLFWIDLAYALTEWAENKGEENADS